MKNCNNWSKFSLVLFALLTFVAIFCLIASIGATFSYIPWRDVSVACLLLIIVSIPIWALGYFSRSRQREEFVEDEQYEEEESDTEIIIENEVEAQAKAEAEAKARAKAEAEAKARAKAEAKARAEAKAQNFQRFDLFRNEPPSCNE